MSVQSAQRFGDLQTNYLYYEDVLNGRQWLCTCICGQQIPVWETMLLSLEKRHCDDLVHGSHEIPLSYIQRLYEGAQNRNHTFNVEAEYLWQVFLNQDRKCAYTGELLVFKEDLKEQTASLDRINSKIGYEPGNVQWVHKTINMMKGRNSSKAFVEWCIKVSDYKNRSILAELFSSED